MLHKTQEADVGGVKKTMIKSFDGLISIALKPWHGFYTEYIQYYITFEDMPCSCSYIIYPAKLIGRITSKCLVLYAEDSDGQKDSDGRYLEGASKMTGMTQP